MTIGIICEGKNNELLKQLLLKHDSNLSIQIWPEIQKPEEVEVLILWKHPENILGSFSNTKFISSFGAGVDHIFSDPSYKPDIPVTRIIDPDLSDGMFKYTLLSILSYEKHLIEILTHQKSSDWGPSVGITRDVKPGILGMGEIGKYIAEKLTLLGYEVHGLSTSKKEVPGVQSFTNSEMSKFLKNINALICTLPLTNDTDGILNHKLFQQLPDHSLLINIGRGDHLNEGDLIKAIKSQKISLAFLDVLSKEPVPKNHPFRNMENIVLTPHIASLTSETVVAEQVNQNINNYLDNLPLTGLSSYSKGY